MLRFIQATFMILTSYPALIASLLPNSPVSVHISAETALFQLQGTLNITRRWMRFFRFFEAFNASYNLFVSDTKSIETWLDVASSSSFAMFGMAESITLPDLLAIDHLEIFGLVKANKINLDAQIFWFIGLYASALSTAVKLVRLFAYAPVPQTGSGYGAGEEKSQEVSKDEKKDDEKASKDGNSVEDMKKERERLRGIVKKRKEDRRAWLKHVRSQAATLGKQLLASVLDLIIPASTMGWVKVDTGIVGIAMWCSTVLTYGAIWARVGKELEKRKV